MRPNQVVRDEASIPALNCPEAPVRSGDFVLFQWYFEVFFRVMAPQPYPVAVLAIDHAKPMDFQPPKILIIYLLPFR